MKKETSYNQAVAREVRVCEAILSDPSWLAAAVDEGLNKQDFQAVVTAGAAAQSAQVDTKGTRGRASGTGASGKVESVAATYGGLKRRVRLAVGDAGRALKAKPNDKLAADLATLSGARFDTPATPRSKKKGKGTAPAAGAQAAGGAADPSAAKAASKSRHASRTLGAVSEEVTGYTTLLLGLKTLTPFLKARGVDAKTITALQSQADALGGSEAVGLSAHDAAHLATDDEHHAVAATHEAWAAISPTLHHVAKTHSGIAKLLK